MARSTSPTTHDSEPLDLGALDLPQLALFVGQAANVQVLEALASKGFADVRTSHGHVFQHLVGGPRTVGDLAGRLGVSQQAASKSVAELVQLGYLAKESAEDRRVSRVGLTARGRDVVRAARQARQAIEKKLARAHGERGLVQARRLLADVLESLGGADAVRTRRGRQAD